MICTKRLTQTYGCLWFYFEEGLQAGCWELLPRRLFDWGVAQMVAHGLIPNSLHLVGDRNQSWHQD